MLITMFSRLQTRVDELGKNFNKVIKYNKEPSELKTTIAEMKNTLKGIKTILKDADEQKSILEDGVRESTQGEKQKENRILKPDDRLRDLWDHITLRDLWYKHTNIHVIKVPEREGERHRKLI